MTEVIISPLTTQPAAYMRDLLLSGTSIPSHAWTSATWHSSSSQGLIAPYVPACLARTACTAQAAPLRRTVPVKKQQRAYLTISSTGYGIPTAVLSSESGTGIPREKGNPNSAVSLSHDYSHSSSLLLPSPPLLSCPVPSCTSFFYCYNFTISKSSLLLLSFITQFFSLFSSHLIALTQVAMTRWSV